MWIKVTGLSKLGHEPGIPVNTDTVCYARNSLGEQAGEYSPTVLKFEDGSELGILESKEWFYDQATKG